MRGRWFLLLLGCLAPGWAWAQAGKLDPALLKKANAGNAQAQFLVGQAYASGQGTAQSDTQAAQWYQKAADQGLATAELELGVLYLAGRGVEQNAVRAAVLLDRAADQGLAAAQLTLGGLYDRAARGFTRATRTRRTCTAGPRCRAWPKRR